MLCDLILDGNYILSKLAYTLHKNNLLYGALRQSLENAITNYSNWYNFSNIYLVSDSKEKSWRKDLYINYKSTRKKDSEIDWQFVYNTFKDFKESLSPNVKILEYSRIEGDDWISFLSKKSNLNGRSTIIVSNDYDIKQLLVYNVDPLYINIMTNEMYNKEKLFIPKNYQLFISKLNDLPNDDIFNLNDNLEFSLLINKFLTKYEVHEIDNLESLFIKLISGDVSDNISSVWVTSKNGKKRGIGEKGAKTIYDQYILEFGSININDENLYENIADLICEKKKISKTNVELISNNIDKNFKLINLDIDNIPDNIVDFMNNTYNNLIIF